MVAATTLAAAETARFRVKDREKHDLFQAISGRAGATRKNLARSLGIRPSTVCAAVQELIDDSLVIEGGARSQGVPGRPELLLRANADRFVAAALYVESRDLKGALVNLGEQVLAQRSLNVPEDADGATFLRCCTDLLGYLRDQVPAGAGFLGAGLSLVGTVDATSKRWLASARWPRAIDVDFTPLAKRWKTEISLRRSLDTELEYQLTRHAAGGNTVLFHWGFGIGSACSHEGAVLDSSLGRFGEIGHTKIDMASAKACACGARGCLETEAALWAILPAIREAFPEVPQDERGFARFVAANPGLLRLAVVRQAVACVKEGLLNLYKLFYPDRLLVIGPFTEAPAIAAELSAYLAASLPQYARERMAFEVIPGGFRGCMFGSTYPFFRAALSDTLRSRF